MNASRIIRSVCDKIQLLYESGMLKYINFKGCRHVLHAFNIMSIPGVQENRVCIIRWFMPDVDWIKINTDGSYNGKVAGCGGIIRNHLGQVIKAFAGPVFGKSACVAELNGIIYGIKMCINLGYDRVWIEVDAMNIFHYIHSNSLFIAENYYLIRELKQNLANIIFKIFHIHREGNGCADALATIGCQLREYVEFNSNDIPRIVNGLVRLDRSGLPYIKKYQGIK
ncbi:Putative ribonuclease H protein [Dendrobium catenatum]|uniref:Ribonuclease H protein n=1 Tax=Dendrobium catenatum TaxID=906689 RepID=A0A2I0W8H5_9ASPA|nr:Putative ribonuclease H protein [Dendrobium catenatum]